MASARLIAASALKPEAAKLAELLSRVKWPTFPFQKVLSALGDRFRQGKIRRICIQALNYPGVFADLEALVGEIKKEAAVPVSVSCQPLDRANIERLAKAGVDRLGVALDAATETLFDRIKGEGSSYRWNNQFRMLVEALAVFGKGNVTTHLIVGLGETEREAMQIIQRCVDLGVLPGLFAFTPIEELRWKRIRRLSWSLQAGAACEIPDCEKDWAC